MTRMLRVSADTHERLLSLVRAEYPGRTVNDVLGVLLDEHWERQAILAVDSTSDAEWEGWRAEMRDLDRLGSPDVDPWVHSTEQAA
jgi:hypothetical protein